MKYSLMLFSSGEGASASASYTRLIELARIADQTGFERIWLPERHYVRFGALHPAPAVLAAALATQTTRLRIAAGSVIAPLHHPLEIAEHWSVVDNLSNGRVDVSLASGWRREDFAARPDAYDNRRDSLATQVDALRDIWSGASHAWDTGGGTAQVVLCPRPVQEQLPLWLTAARAEETFRLAGRKGLNLLTYLVDLGFDGLRAGLAAYRSARAEAGFDPNGGEITVMLHSYVIGPGTLSIGALQQRYCDYLVGNRDLLGLAAAQVSQSDAKALATAQFDRVHERMSLMGRPEALLPVVARLADMGVTELACLVDFIDDFDAVEAALPGLTTLAQSGASRAGAATSKVPTATSMSRRIDITSQDFYAYIESIGGAYGPDFQLLKAGELRGATAVATLMKAEGTDDPATVHLDSVVSLAHLFAQSPGLRAATQPLSLPVGFGRLQPATTPAGEARAEVTSKGRQGNRELFDILVTDATGALCTEIEDLAFERMRMSGSDARIKAADALVKRRGWREIQARLGDAPTLQLETTDDPACAARSQSSSIRRPPRVEDPLQPFLLVERDTRAEPEDRALQALDWIARTRQREGIEALIVMVSGAVRIHPDEAAPDPVAAAVWAAAGSVLRSPGQAPVRVIDFDAGIDADDLNDHLHHAVRTDAPMVAQRGAALFVPELDSSTTVQGTTPAMPSAIPENAKILLTGGTGGIGPWLCDFLGEEGAGRIDILTRDAARPMPQTGIPRCPVRWLEASLDDGAALRRILAGEYYDMVFHLAGDLAADPDLDDAARLRRAFAPKCEGLTNLIDAMAGRRPQHLVLFSSIAALTGGPGQSAYAAANAAMAAAAQDLAPLVTTLHFGPWDGGGMVAASGTEEAIAAKGLRPMPAWLALRAMANVLARGVTEAVIADFDAASAHPSARPAVMPDATPAPPTEITATALREIVLRLFADILETEPEALDTEANLYALGFDSIMALEMRNAVQADLGIDMQLSALMDAQSISDIIARLQADLASGALQGDEREGRQNASLIL